jgi:RNA polymerase sigma-70 factor (ECF subfamily)
MQMERSHSLLPASPRAQPEADEKLVLRARAGDERAVRSLVQRHNRRLFRMARGILRDDGEAEDVVQETYVRAFTRLDRYRGEAAFGTWLSRIAMNEAYGRLRRRRPSVEWSDDGIGGEADRGRIILFPGACPPPEPESEASRGQVRAILEQAIDRLPEPFRLVLVLRDVEGLDVEETANLLGILPQTVKTRLFRARRLMRGEMEKALLPHFEETFPFDGQRCARMADRVALSLRSRYAISPPSTDR